MFPCPGNLSGLLGIFLGEVAYGGNLDVDVFEWEVIARR